MVHSKGRVLNIYNPSTGEVAGHVNVAEGKLIDETVTVAHKAFQTWSMTTPTQRAQILFRFKSLLDANIKPLAQLITQEHGKLLIEAIGSVQRGIDVVDFTCGIPNHLKGSFAEEVTEGMDCYSLHQPVGVCVGITPFNFPGMIPLWMFPMAIACGNTFILKPSEKDPSCSIKLVELAKEAGIPDGVVNVLQGDKETVEGLITHPGVKAVSFVGSSAAAEHVYKTAINYDKRAQAFGGAKNHCIVMPDADLDQAAAALAASAYGSAGERCMAISVVVAVGDDLANNLVEKIRQKMAEVDMGPLVTQQHWERVKSYVEIGKQEGAALVVDGSNDKPKENAKGFYMGACLFDKVKPSMRIYQEEIFGPVLSIVRVPDFEMALKLVSEHEYGNGTAIFTRDGFIARTFAEKVQVGMVGINVPIPVPVAYQSFGGWKHSIFADTGMYGSEAVRFYTKLKTVTQRWFPKEKV
jgi:malonate-semialdehyde dehydrogenase (acetylating)/methylmalonate-semialdehyde dehydrogenase